VAVNASPMLIDDEIRLERR